MSKAGEWLKAKAPGLHRALTRRDSPYPVLREVLVAIVAIVLLVGLLYGLTAQPFSGGYPVVVVTSGSMMHCTNVDNPNKGYGSECDTDTFAGLGRIDPGDLVFVRKVTDPLDVDTHLDPDASHHYGESGDVVVYRPHQFHHDLQTTPIIHRALFWLQIGSDRSRTAVFHGGSLPFEDQRVMDIMGHCSIDPSHLDMLGPADSGFITKGDNNGGADQCANGQGFNYDPVSMPMVLGKARGELPWIGLVKLFVDDSTQGTPNFAHASGTAKTMLVVSIVVLVAAPWTLDVVLRRRARKTGDADQADADDEAASDSPKSRRRKKD